METGNLYRAIPAPLPDEAVDILAAGGTTRIERIVSRGHASPPDFWYDQHENEWVVVLQGAARLRFAEADRTVELRAGDHVQIRARERHRVEWTMPDCDTVWLAVFYPA